MSANHEELAFSAVTEKAALAELSEEIMRARIEDFLQQ